MWAGIAGASHNDGYAIAISIHDSVYNTDFSSQIIPFSDKAKRTVRPEDVEHHVIDAIKTFSQEHLCKFLGAGVTLTLLKDVRAP